MKTVLTKEQIKELVKDKQEKINSKEIVKK